MLADLDSPLSAIAEPGQDEAVRVRADDRRSDRRFAVRGSLLRVPAPPFSAHCGDNDVRDLLLGFMPALWTQRREVVDLSLGGLAFESSSPIARGRKLRMQLWIPGLPQALGLCAETRWCKRLLGRQYCVGVRFEPFSAQPGHDAQAAFEVLRQLEAKHG